MERFFEIMALLRDAETHLKTCRAMICCDCLDIAHANFEIAEKKIGDAKEILEKIKEERRHAA